MVDVVEEYGEEEKKMDGEEENIYILPGTWELLPLRRGFEISNC